MKLSTKNIKIDGSKLKINIVLPYFNDIIGNKLLKNTKDELIRNQVQRKNISVTRVSGALEIPFACQKIIKEKLPDAIIALGVIIRGETSHYELVTTTTYQGIMHVQIEEEIPIIFGILACENQTQAKKRLHKGTEAAQAALIQATL